MTALFARSYKEKWCPSVFAPNSHFGFGLCYIVSMLILIDADEKYLIQYQEAYVLSLDKIKRGEMHRRNLMFHDIHEVDVIQKMRDTRDKSKLKPNRVLSYDYFAVDNDRFIGVIHIRVELTPFLYFYGGHIGYGINPKYWRQGYGTELLRIGLIKAKGLITEDKVLVTCDDNNTGSAKVIENNGGILENKVTNRDEYGDEVLTRRYWIRIR